MLSVRWAFHSHPADVTVGRSEQCIKCLKFLWYLQLQPLSRSLWTEKYIECLKFLWYLQLQSLSRSLWTEKCNRFCDHHCLVLDAIVWMWDSRSSQGLGRIKWGNWQFTWQSGEEAGKRLVLMGSSRDCWCLFRLVCCSYRTQVDNGLLKHIQCQVIKKKKEKEKKLKSPTSIQWI